MERRLVLEDELSASVAELIVVAIGKDKESSKFALRWALTNLFQHDDGNMPILVHVKTNLPAVSENKKYDAEIERLFNSYRMYCARKGVHIKEVVLEDNDVSKALLTYIKTNHISNIVLGSTKGNHLSKWMKVDVPNNVMKNAPDFCSVYVVSKTKLLAVKQAQRRAANTAAPPKMPFSVALPLLLTFDQLESENSKEQVENPGHRSTFSDGLPSEKILEAVTKPPRNKHRSAPVSMENIEFDLCTSEMSSFSRDSFSDDYDDSGVSSFGSLDVDGHPDTMRDVEAEMRRLKLELKQTMDMYNNACKEAISAKKKESVLQELKKEETHKLEEARKAEEKARAMLEKEKRKYEVAIEAAEASKKLAEMEARKRKDAELKLKQAEDLLLSSCRDLRYRKYTIEEIEAATEKFSDARKIGEGGYGPVFKGYLDHTVVAIKLLRPDSSQGRKQFQQEVEILSFIRHPNMVTLIGACPDYGCLVYEYMDNGNLEDRLLQRGMRSPLSWRKRFQIAAEIATTLAFLHQSKPEPIVHRDLKPSNILLDRNDVSKISDVGLARLLPAFTADNATQYRMTYAAGTFCYMDPEYQQSGILTKKSDVYSLGVLLLQIITARPPMGLITHVQNAIANNKIEEILDPCVTDWPVEEALAFAQLALKCAELRQKDRPDLSSVIVPELNQFTHIKKRSGLSTRMSESSLASTHHSSSCSLATVSSQASTLVSYGSGSDTSDDIIGMHGA